MIYLDHNASTPLDPAARDAMLPFLSEIHGNPTSGHAIGRRLREAVETARTQLAGLIGATAEEIVFTSGGTESNNHVIKTVAHARRESGRHLIISAVEHPAVTNPCRYLETCGYDLTLIGVDKTGRVDPRDVAGAIRPDTVLISVMLANNEVGTIQPIAEISALARKHGIFMHTDAAQAIGKIPVDVRELGVDFLSLAGHKFYAPQGIGALYVRSGVELDPFHHGAGHQGGRRSGTEPVPTIVGLGRAAEVAASTNDADAMRALCDRLFEGIQSKMGEDIVRLGHPVDRLPNTLAVGFRGLVGGDVLAACPNIAASTGAACHAGNRKRSATLAAMDVAEAIAFGAVRFSVGRTTTEAEVDQAIAQLLEAVASVRA